jgi:hypothetical protein
MASKKYYYTSDTGKTYFLETAEHLAVAAGLVEIPKGAAQPAPDTSGFTDLRHIWAKEAVPSSKGSTKRVKLIVQSDSPLFRTRAQHPVYIKDVLYITTGRVGESLTFIVDSTELIKELSKDQKEQNHYPQRLMKSYYYTGDDGNIYVHSTAEYLALAAGLQEVPANPADRKIDHHGIGYVSSSLNYPRYIWVKEANPRFSGKTQRIKIVLNADRNLYKTDERQPVYIDGDILYRSTGRVGEAMTFWGASEELNEALRIYDS